ncbi:MAG: helix-turn-helix transcriptional regulator [Anaerolineae bacterium]|nr:helix-turn-helix transcriptional regulator [Gemmatimonadaceae bacterium]
MDVLARVSPPLLSQLRVVLGRDDSLGVVPDWNTLTSEVARFPCDVAIVDPVSRGSGTLTELALFTSSHRSLPVVVYTVLSPEAMLATVELVKCGIAGVVIRGFDDEPVRFRSVLRDVSANELSEALLASVAEHFASAPVMLLQAIEQLFRSPLRFQDVGDLARAASMTRRGLDRWMDDLGVAPAMTFVKGARMLRAYHYMRDPVYRFDDVAAKLGYSERAFARQMRVMTGQPPSMVRERFGAKLFVAKLAERLCQRAIRNDEDNPETRTRPHPSRR